MPRLPARPTPTLASFTAELAERAAAQHVPTVEGVTLASLHAAKGLEWDAVFLVSLVEGVLPISYATTPEAVEEERRLLYVGVTRARRHLTLSWAKAREAGRRPRKPSRFLDGARAGRAGRPRRPRARSGAGRRRQVDPQLWEALRQWRSEQAAEQKQPAFCVFTDATLEAIASKRPATLQQLRRCREWEPPSSSGSGPPSSMSFRRRAKALKLQAIAARAAVSTRHEKFDAINTLRALSGRR